MYDFIGRVREIRSTQYQGWSELEVWDACEGTRDDNFAIFRINERMLMDAGVGERDWVKVRFVLEGRIGRNNSRYCNAQCRRLKVLAKAPAEDDAPDVGSEQAHDEEVECPF